MEIEDFVNGLAITEKMKILESDMGKVQSLIATQCGQITDFEQKIASLQLQIISASVEDLSGLSKQKAKITAAKAESEILLNDLSGRKKDIEAALKKIKDSLQPEILGFLRARRKSFEKEVFDLIQNMVEPKLSGWELFAFESTRRFGFDLNKAFFELPIKIYSPLLSEAVKNVMSPIRYD
jgi:hypothetical protein